MKYSVLDKILHLVESLFWVKETCVSSHQFVQKLYLVFDETETMKGFLSMDLWRKFRLAELD